MQNPIRLHRTISWNRWRASRRLKGDHHSTTVEYVYPAIYLILIWISYYVYLTCWCSDFLNLFIYEHYIVYIFFLPECTILPILINIFIINTESELNPELISVSVDVYFFVQVPDFKVHVQSRVYKLFINLFTSNIWHRIQVWNRIKELAMGC